MWILPTLIQYSMLPLFYHLTQGQMILSKCLSSNKYSKDSCGFESNMWSTFRTVTCGRINISIHKAEFKETMPILPENDSIYTRNHRHEMIWSRTQFYYNIKETNYILKRSKLVLDTRLISSILNNSYWNEDINH